MAKQVMLFDFHNMFFKTLSTEGYKWNTFIHTKPSIAWIEISFKKSFFYDYKKKKKNEVEKWMHWKSYETGS